MTVMKGLATAQETPIMAEKPWRLYLDTSVIGGCFDPEFAEDSRRVIDAILSGQARLLFSEVVEAELRDTDYHKPKGGEFR